MRHKSTQQINFNCRARGPLLSLSLTVDARISSLSVSTMKKGTRTSTTSLAKPFIYETQKSKSAVGLSEGSDRAFYENQVLEFELLKTDLDNFKSHSRQTLIDLHNTIINPSSSTATLPLLLKRTQQNTMRQSASAPMLAIPNSAPTASRVKLQVPLGRSTGDGINDTDKPVALSSSLQSLAGTSGIKGSSDAVQNVMTPTEEFSNKKIVLERCWNTVKELKPQPTTW
jgi:hypothetical protein